MSYTVCYKGPDASYSDNVATWQEGFDAIGGVLDMLRPPRSYVQLLSTLNSKMIRRDLPFHMTDGEHIFELKGAG